MLLIFIQKNIWLHFRLSYADNFSFVMLHNSNQKIDLCDFLLGWNKVQRQRSFGCFVVKTRANPHFLSFSFLLPFLVSSRNVGHIIWHCFMYNLKYYVKRRPLIFILLMIKRANKANLILTEEKNNKTMSVWWKKEKEADIHTEKQRRKYKQTRSRYILFFLSSFKILRLLVVFVLYQFFKSLKRVYSSWYISAVTR